MLTESHELRTVHTDVPDLCHFYLLSEKVGHPLTTQVWSRGLFLWAQWKFSLVTKVCCLADYTNIPQLAGAGAHTHTHACTYLPDSHTGDVMNPTGASVGSSRIWGGQGVYARAPLLYLHITVRSLESVSRVRETTSTERCWWRHCCAIPASLYARTTASRSREPAGGALNNICHMQFSPAA